MIRLIPCACNACTDQLGFPWNPRSCDEKQPRYQFPQHCVYSKSMGKLNKRNIITLANKYTEVKLFEILHNILSDGICDTMNILVETFNFGALSSDDNSEHLYYIVKIVYEYTQYNMKL